MIGMFKLVRHEDVSGISGTGLVAYGCEYPDGTCTLRWCVGGKAGSTAVYATLEDLMSIHLHGDKTILSWIWRIDESTLEVDPAKDVRGFEGHTKPRG